MLRWRILDVLKILDEEFECLDKEMFMFYWFLCLLSIGYTHVWVLLYKQKLLKFMNIWWMMDWHTLHTIVDLWFLIYSISNINHNTSKIKHWLHLDWLMILWMYPTVAPICKIRSLNPYVVWKSVPRQTQENCSSGDSFKGKVT
jgi:hypothetical protein